jgi:hypothetical protein
MVPHVLSSTNCGLGCFKNTTKYFFCTNSHFLSGLTTAQVVDPLPVYRDFPGWTKEIPIQEEEIVLQVQLSINCGLGCFRNK